MDDANVSNDLRQLAHGQVKALEYSRYGINGYHFQIAKLEASRPLAVTTNSGVVTSGEDVTSHVTNYYGILQEGIEVHQDFMVTNRAGLTELATSDAELLDEEACPLKNAFKNQSVFLKDKKDVSDLMHVSQKQIPMLMTFDM
jgi:hypothetical protein